MHSPSEETDPNRAQGPAARGLKRGAPSPAAEAGKRKPSKKDRRRVSFAPDPELTLVHHFDKDEFTGNSGGDAAGLHPALAGYQPGFIHMTVPENSPLNEPVPMDSPGQVSMELTVPVQAAMAAQQQQAAQQQGQEVGGWQADHVPGEVTAALPSLGALAEADELADEVLGGVASWEGLEPTVNLTGNITAALPGLGSLVAEDEDATAGMDLTEPTGVVLAVAATNPEPTASAQQQREQELAAEPEDASAVDPTTARLSTGTDELEAVAANQAAKWGFAPGREDTMDINLEMHGRMIMGDNTFMRTYGDNITGDSEFVQGGGDDTADSLQPREQLEQQAVAAAAPEADEQQAVAPSPDQEEPQVVAVARGPSPDWNAPAFLPPYMQPTHSAHNSDHPALVHSPAITNSSLNTLDTRRVSVDIEGRRASLDLRRGSRRFSTATSMQDATGRLLADEGDDLVSPVSQGGQGRRLSRRRSSGISLLGKDVTENLLADDETLAAAGASDADVLAGLHKQVRILSHGGSPGVAPAPHLSMVLEEEEEGLASEGAAAVAQGAEEEAPGASEVAAPGLLTARSPRTTVSLGYADSHNPATMAILRSGGTTRLLRDTVHVPGAAAPNFSGGVPAGTGDAAPTGFTNGTTKLLADMTMASSIGVKLLQRPSGGAGAGLTDFSLEEFERPPELPGSGAAEAQDQELLAAAEAAQQGAPAGHADFLSPAQQRPGLANYPIDAVLDHEEGGIPGGPKLARTPLSSRAPGSLPPRSAHGTPASFARSQRSHSHAPTPGMGRTPGSVAVPAASYPMDVDAIANQIPGGPKLARTPMGRTPATAARAGLAVPGSAVAQHYPGSALPPGSYPGSALRHGGYPGSAIALHRGGHGMTPLPSGPPPMTFQDFAKIMEVAFLDNLRRGTSINYADLQPNPVPVTLGDSYRLMCITAPAVAELEAGIRTLQQEVQARRVSAADAETMVGQMNPPVFREVQHADVEQLEAIKANVALLKRVCRQKAMALLKEFRAQMEESRGAKLRRQQEALAHDLEFAEEVQRHMEGVAAAVQQHIAEQQRRMVDEVAERSAEAERRRAAAGAAAEAEALAAANQARQAALAEAQARVAALAAQAGEVAREKTTLQSRADALQVTLQQSQGQAALARDSSPAAVLQKLEALDVLKSCVGWQLESAAEDPVNGELSLRLADLFRLRLNISRAGVAGAVELLPESAVPSSASLPADRRALAGVLAGCTTGERTFQLSATVGAGGLAAKLGAAVQAAAARLGRIAGLVAELDGLRLAVPALAEVACTQSGCVRLTLLNLDAEVKFAVELAPGPHYPAGPLLHTTRIWFDGRGQINERNIVAAVAGVPEAPGRLRGVAAALAELARSAVPRPAVAADIAFHRAVENPLFGGEQQSRLAAA